MSRLKEKIVYVIREIIIVAIGVLFAFFISNTSKSINERKREKIVVLDLLDDIRYNIEQTGSTINEANEYLEVCTNTVSLLKTSHFSIDSLPYVLPALTRDYSTQINSTTYESIKNTGELSIIRDKEIRRLIVEYYVHAKDVRRAESAYSRVSADARNYINNNIEIINIRNHPIEILDSREFYNTFYSAMFYTSIRQEYYNIFLNKSTSVAELINNYFDSL